MENKIDILKKLGFSDDYLKIISEESHNPNMTVIQASMYNFENINSISSDITQPVIEKTEKPINSYFSYNERQK